MRPLPMVGRYAVILLPTEQYLAWTMTCPEADENTTLADVRDDPTVYLVPEAETPGKTRRFLRQNYQRMLREELLSWCTDDRYWPEDQSYEAFCRLFEVQVMSIIYDMADGPIEKEEWDDDE